MRRLAKHVPVVRKLLIELESKTATLAATQAELADSQAQLVSIAKAFSEIRDQVNVQLPLLRSHLAALGSNQADNFRMLRDRLTQDAVHSSQSTARDMYLDLLETALTGTLNADESIAPWSGSSFDSATRAIGRDWPRTAQTMIGTARMRNLRSLLERVILERVPGDFIETGVWRGGACIYAKGIFMAHGETKRRVFVADSFNGLPPPDVEKYPADAGDQHHTVGELAVSSGSVKDNFRRYGLLDDNVFFLEGWFKDTLPKAPIDKLAVLRLDGDMYESTMDTLTNLYHKVSPNGFVIIDDYILPACAAAVKDFRHKNNIAAPLQEVDGAAVWWQIS
jgi:hypothetical protein